MKLVLVLLVLAVGALGDDDAPADKLVPEHKPEDVPPVVSPAATYSYVYPYSGYPYVRYLYYPNWYLYPFTTQAAPAVPAAPAPRLLPAPYAPVGAPVGASTFYGQWQ